MIMSYAVDLVPTLCVGMQPGRSASDPGTDGDVPTRSVGTRKTRKKNISMTLGVSPPPALFCPRNRTSPPADRKDMPVFSLCR